MFGLYAGALAVVPAFAIADQTSGATLVFEEPVGGVYTQGWYAQIVDSRGRTAQHLYVTGDGKLGDFHGLISVDCAKPSRSQWLATGG